MIAGIIDNNLIYLCEDENCAKKLSCKRYLIKEVKKILPFRFILSARDKNDDECYCLYYIHVPESERNKKIYIQQETPDK